ncbi:zinc-ribbon domain containing protein [Chloroflexota bacterium]
MVFEDRSLTCVECGAEFVFTAGEQEFYQSRGLENEPKRCPDCRRAKRQGRYRGGGMETRRYKVNCDSCGAEADIPFEPREGRPVYCNECFARMRENR